MIVKFLRILKKEGYSGIHKRLKSRLRKLKYALLHQIGSESVTSTYGIVMRKNWKDATFRFCVEGTYGTFFSNHLRSKNKNFNFLDIGANQGLYTLIAAQNLCCDKVLCVEPVKHTFLKLVENIHLNKVSEKVMALNFGLGIKSESISIFLRENHSGAASQISHHPKENLNSETIEIVTAQILSDLSIINNKHPIVCKIDVEGKEIDVLKTLIGHQIIESDR